MQNDRKITWLHITLLCFLIFSLTSCLEVKQSINLNKDGSGDARMEIAVQQEWASQVIPKLKSDLPKGWNLLEEKQQDGKQVVAIGRKFKDITELNDNEMRYRFSSERKSFLKRTYAFEVIQLKSSDAPFPFELSVTMPGNVEETSGNKLSSNSVKWNLQGFRRGTQLAIKSSAFALPDFASLKNSFNNSFDSIFYKEAIVFLRDKNIFVMDSDGKDEKQLTKEGVGSWSVSTDRKNIVYEEKNNCYVILFGDAAKKLTDTNDCFSPVISPDGSKIAFVKTDDKFSATEAQQMVSEGYNPAYVKEGAIKKTGVYFIDLKTREQKRIVSELPATLSSKMWGSITKWIDYSLHWSPDGNRLHFTRDFIPYAEKGGLRDAYLINVSNNEIEHIGSQGRHVLNWSNGKIIYTEEGYCYIYDLTSKKEQRQSLNEFYRYPTFECLDWYAEKVLFSASDYSKGVILIFDTKTDKYKIVDSDVPYGIRGNFSSDGKRIVYGYKGNLWTIDTDGSNKKQIAFNLPLSGEKTWFLNTLLWQLDGKFILSLLEVKGPANETNSSWVINPDGSNLKKLADNAASPRITSIPRLSFIAPNVAKIIILVAMALTGILLLVGVALFARKTVKTITPKSKVKLKGIFCAHCGKENSRSASFCASCGQKIKI